MNALDIVTVGDGYRITIRRSVRKVVPLKIRQKVAMVPSGDKIIVQPLPDKPDEELSELVNDIEFNRKAREKASKFLLSQSQTLRTSNQLSVSFS